MLVNIKNFQSIEDVTFEIPEKQFTCIVGPSNIGKSALRRAFECLIYNKSEVSYIRNGTKSCSVEVTFDDGCVVKWYRDKKTAGYVINGDDFTKLAGSVPEVLEDRGYKELVVNKDRYQVQIASQFNNLFLLNQTGGKVTEVLSNLGNLNRIINSNKACQTDLKSNKSRLSVRRDDVVSAKEKLKSYEGLEDQKKLVEGLKTGLRDIKAVKDKVDSVKRVASSLDKSLLMVKALRPAQDVTIESFDLDLNKLTTTKKLITKLSNSQALCKAYLPIKDVPEISLDISADTLIKLKALKTKYDQYSSKEQHYTKLADVNLIEFDLKEDYITFKTLQDYLRRIESAKVRIGLYRNLPEDKLDNFDLDLTKFKKANALYNDLLSTKEKVLKFRDEQTIAEEKLNKLIEEKDKIHKELGVCPLCNKEF